MRLGGIVDERGKWRRMTDIDASRRALFVVLLRFAGNRDQAGQLLAGHKEWIRRGLDDGVFLVAGSLQPGAGGAILAHNTSLVELEERVGHDPFVAEDVVRAEVLEITPAQVDERLRFMLDQPPASR